MSAEQQSPFSASTAELSPTIFEAIESPSPERDRFAESMRQEEARRVTAAESLLAQNERQVGESLALDFGRFQEGFPVTDALFNEGTILSDSEDTFEMLINDEAIKAHYPVLADIYGNRKLEYILSFTRNEDGEADMTDAVLRFDWQEVTTESEDDAEAIRKAGESKLEGYANIEGFELWAVYTQDPKTGELRDQLGADPFAYASNLNEAQQAMAYEKQAMILELFASGEAGQIETFEEAYLTEDGNAEYITYKYVKEADGSVTMHSSCESISLEQLLQMAGDGSVIVRNHLSLEATTEDIAALIELRELSEEFGDDDEVISATSPEQQKSVAGDGGFEPTVEVMAQSEEIEYTTQAEHHTEGSKFFLPFSFEATNHEVPSFVPGATRISWEQSTTKDDVPPQAVLHSMLRNHSNQPSNPLQLRVYAPAAEPVNGEDHDEALALGDDRILLYETTLDESIQPKEVTLIHENLGTLAIDLNETIVEITDTNDPLNPRELVVPVSREVEAKVTSTTVAESINATAATEVIVPAAEPITITQAEKPTPTPVRPLSHPPLNLHLEMPLTTGDVTSVYTAEEVRVSEVAASETIAAITETETATSTEVSQAEEGIVHTESTAAEDAVATHVHQEVAVTNGAKVQELFRQRKPETARRSGGRSSSSTAPAAASASDDVSAVADASTPTSDEPVATEETIARRGVGRSQTAAAQEVLYASQDGDHANEVPLNIVIDGLEDLNNNQRARVITAARKIAAQERSNAGEPIHLSIERGGANELILETGEKSFALAA